MLPRSSAKHSRFSRIKRSVRSKLQFNTGLSSVSRNRHDGHFAVANLFMRCVRSQTITPVKTQK
jgi:hypothetical protein